ncbi:GatB/YqeY domain-containing protein [Patescibacteria group bacterium]|nr:GatB/YqeY domain-containing protein [Patescibacteria group bacterium]
MKLVEKLDNDFKSALKNKDAEKLSIFRLVRSSIKNLEISKHGEASDEDVIEILQREIKQHKESIDANKTAKRKDEVNRLQAEVELLQPYLPEGISSDELKDVVECAIAEIQAVDVSDMGKVMGKVMPQVKGRTTGDEVNQMVRNLLQNNKN